MSRCFPYPPPGYTLSSAQNEALIELIKLQKEKQRKKEKKEKRKERKEKRKDETNQNPNKSDIPKHQFSQNGRTDTKVEFLHKKRKAETELEQSSLTEEHACPASLAVPSSSSESTEKSNKRKRNSSPGDDTHVHGKVILMPKLSNKLTQLDALTNEQQQQSCSTSERPDTSDGSRDVDCGSDMPAKFLNRSSNSSAQNTKQICSTSGQIEAGKTGTNNKTMFPKKAILNSMQKLELQYKTLLEDFFPPPIQDGCDFPTEDLDWLLSGRNQEKQAEKKSRFGSESLSCSRSVGLWPRAQYLPEVEIYALPYTVPY